MESSFHNNRYYKFVRGFSIEIDIRNPSNIEGYVNCESCFIYDEIVIDRMKEAFKEMKKDLEKLKESEKKCQLQKHNTEQV